MQLSEASPAASHGWPAKAVAKAIIEKAARRHIVLRCAQLHKLLYFAHGLMLARHGRRLVQEPFHVWVHGPMVPELYHNLRVYGLAPLKPDHGFIPVWDDLESDATDVHVVIEQVLDQLGRYPASTLSALTREPNGPWQAAVNDHADHRPLDDERIATYFRTLLH